MRLLIVEDEKSLSDPLVEILKQNKYIVDAVYNGQDGLEYGMTGVYDIIILDIMLPKINGFEVLKILRKEKVTTPVLLLTAKYDIQDKITGLDLGADDYLTKPFASDELLARLRAISRRKGEYTGDNLSFNTITLSKSTYELSNGGQKVRLGLKEYQIMEMLISNSKQIIPKERFIDKIWGYDCNSEYNNIEVYISFLRKKLQAVHSKVQIKTIRGVGYSLEENI